MSKRKRISQRRPSDDAKTVASMLAELYKTDFKTAFKAYVSQKYSIKNAKQVLGLATLNNNKS